MKQISIPLEILVNLADVEGQPLARDASPEKLCADIGARYGFLSRRVEVQLADSTVTIRWAPETKEDQAQAARLLERAGRRAREGEYERVTDLCRQALRLQPELREARRELVRSYLRAGDRASAQIALRQALWLDPRDVGSLVTLSDLLTEGGEADKAERPACLALELEPANVAAIQALGRAQLLAENAQEALGAFARALLIQPQSIGARLGAARALLRQHKPDDSLEILHGVFAEAGANRRITPEIAEARDLYAQAPGGSRPTGPRSDKASGQ